VLQNLLLFLCSETSRLKQSLILRNCVVNNYGKVFPVLEAETTHKISQSIVIARADSWKPACVTVDCLLL